MAVPDIPVVVLALANERTQEEGFLRGLSLEQKAIMQVLESPIRRGLIELKILPAATSEDIATVFSDPWLENRIEVFHYAGHADGAVLHLETEDQENLNFSAMGVARLLGAQNQNIPLVFLNACATLEHAAELAKFPNVKASIVTSVKIADDQAVTFAKVFYSGMAAGSSLEESFREAEAVLLGNAQDVEREFMSRALNWRKKKEAPPARFPWQMHPLPAQENQVPFEWKYRLLKTQGISHFTSADKDSPEAYIGLIIDDYRIVKFLGGGRSGMVFKAVSNTFTPKYQEVEVAIKVTHRVASGFEVLEEIILTGNRALAQLKHPNVVRVFHTGRLGRNRVYDVMEIVKGERLDKLDLKIPERDEEGVNQLVKYAIQICEGIRNAHDARYVDGRGNTKTGILHGNLQARKVLFTPAGLPKIVDFMFSDLTKVEEISFDIPDQSRKKLPPNKRAEYLPPEVVDGSVPISPKSDLYSLGVLFFEVLTGKDFQAVKPTTENQILNLMRDRNPALPSGLAFVVFKAVHPNPSERFNKVEEMISELEASIDSTQKQISVAEIVQATERKDSESVRRSFLGREIKGFHIDKYLGEGKQGLVFSGHHKEKGTKAAIKFTYRILEGFEKVYDILNRNFVGMHSLNHPNIPRALDVGILGEEEYIFVINEMVEGTRIDKIDFNVPELNESGVLDLIGYAIQLCHGIHAAHTHEFVDHRGKTIYGLLHGNLKTRKVILNEEGVPCIIDFMFTEITNDPEIIFDVPEETRKWVEQEERLDYLPPEVVANRRKITKQTDVYSLGAIFYSLLSGRKLSDFSPEPVSKVYKVLQQRNSYIPSYIADAIFKSIHPDPYLRYATVEQMIQELEAQSPMVRRLWRRFRKLYN
ncbi:MAG: protein kinase [Bacteroidota bacterium]